MWEKKVGELQARCGTLEEEKYEALAKVRESVQLAEEAALQKDQVLHSELPFLFDPVAFVCFSSLFISSFADSLRLSPPAGLVKGETEGRGAGEDKGGHQTVYSRRSCSHQKRGEQLI